MLATPFFPPRRGIVFRVGVIDVRGQAFDGVFEGGEEWRLRIAEEGSVKVGSGRSAHSHGDWPRLVGEVVGACYARFIELCWDECKWDFWGGLG